ncbi:MAG: hypothetical protein ACXWVH_08400, partial [Caulobacteraceae bacterium]
MAFIPGTTGDNSLTGGSGADQIFGFGGKDTIDGGGGDDLIVAGSGGNDLIDGGSGIDKVVLEEDSTGQSLTFDGLGRLDVSGPGGAIESLSGVEQVVFNDRTALVVGAGSEYVTLQQAIDAAEEGDIIIIAAGSYSGNVNVNKEGLTIIAQDGAVLTGTFLSDNGFSDHVDVALRTAPGYSGAAGAGLTISADNITIVGLTIASYLTGVEIGDVSGLTLDGVNIEDTVNGIRKGTEADITDLNIIGGLISHSVFGINFAKALNLSQGFVDGVEINGTSFEHLM